MSSIEMDLCFLLESVVYHTLFLTEMDVHHDHHNVLNFAQRKCPRVPKPCAKPGFVCKARYIQNQRYWNPGGERMKRLNSKTIAPSRVPRKIFPLTHSTANCTTFNHHNDYWPSDKIMRSTNQRCSTKEGAVPIFVNPGQRPASILSLAKWHR